MSKNQDTWFWIVQGRLCEKLRPSANFEQSGLFLCYHTKNGREAFQVSKTTERYNQAATFTVTQVHMITHSHKCGREMNKRKELGTRGNSSSEIFWFSDEGGKGLSMTGLEIAMAMESDHGHEKCPLAKENPWNQDGFPKQKEVSLCTE